MARRRDRSWGVVVLRRAGMFERWAERGIARAADEMSALIERVDKERLAEVRARIDRKMVRRLPPVDVYYHVLDGLHTMTGYDHSAALFMLDPGSRSLTLVAERLAWGKRKSARIGVVLPLPDEVRTTLGEGAVYGFNRTNGAWEEWTDGAAPITRRPGRWPGRRRRARRGGSAVRPLGTADGVVGILTIAGQRPDTFGPWERRILQEFAWLAGFVVERAQSLANLQATMIGAHRRHALADLARGVAHDLNNAMGEMIPLTQQMQSDLESGVWDKQTFTEDLTRLHESLQVCRRIFGSMLRFARGSQRTVGWGNVRKALEGTIAVLRESFERQRVALELDLPEDLPDALRPGGSRAVVPQSRDERARVDADRRQARDPRDAGAERVEVRFVDTGSGIPPELLAQIEQPFFSTKAEGTGLRARRAGRSSSRRAARCGSKAFPTPGRRSCSRSRPPRARSGLTVRARAGLGRRRRGRHAALDGAHPRPSTRSCLTACRKRRSTPRAGKHSTSRSSTSACREWTGST
jgi:signal transduction histidine kinase